MADFQVVLSDTTHIIPFLMISSTDHVAAVTGITPTVTLSKNGGAPGAATGTVAEVGNGNYKLTPSAADVGTLGSLVLHATGTGADPTDVSCQVIAVNIYDVVALGLTRLDVAVSTRNSVAPDNATITAIAGYVDTEVAAIKAKTDLIPASPAAVGSAMTLDLTQALSAPAATDGTQAHTLGEALNAARAQGFGKWAIVGTQLRLYAPNGSTIWRTFTLDSATAPTSRT